MNPLRTPKYDVRAWDEYTRANRQANYEYSVTMMLLAAKRYPQLRYNAAGRRICGDPTCTTELTYLRARLCEPHREGRYQAAKEVASWRNS